MTGFGRNREYSAGNALGRTYDDGQGAKLLRPENRVPFVDSKDKDATAKLRDALIYAGIMQAGEEAASIASIKLETINAPVDESGTALETNKEGDAVDNDGDVIEEAK